MDYIRSRMLVEVLVTTQNACWKDNSGLLGIDVVD